MGKVTINYNEFDLSSLIEIHDIKRDVGNNRVVTTNTSLFLGSVIQRYKIDSKKITVSFSIWTRDRNTVKHQLASIFNQSEPKRLLFSDEPDKYYLALVVDEIQMQEASIKRSYGTITFLIPDGVAHSTTYKKVTDYTESDGKMIFNIVNKGNVEALPIISIKHNAENGYVGLVNQTGVMAVGDEDIIGSEVREHSLRPFDYSETGTGIVDGLAKGAKNVAILNDTSQVLDKSLFVGPWLGRDHLFLDSNVSPAGNHAGSLTFDLPSEGSLYDYFWWRQVFWVGAVNQCGFIKIMVSDTDGKFLYGVETIKRKNGLETEYNFFVTDGQGSYKQTSFMKKFNATHLNSDNPFNEPRGWSDVLRKDDEVSLFWFGSRTIINCPELKGKKSAKLHVAIGSLGGKPLVTRMYVDGIKYRKDNSYLPPNPFGAGSELIINSENDTLLVDNIPKINNIVDGSDFLKIPVGTSQLELYKSSWATTAPTVEIKFEERYL
ncbi:distal tail protein Dit [Streptococcus uberis]|uniref:distal tail protein Dit n=1 Tax=Streptococcus uberis TaxID=1349 RepID=UPI003891D2F8